MDEDWRNEFGILMCREIYDGVGKGICDGAPSACSSFLCKSTGCGYSFELHQQVDAIQMGTHNICSYKEVEKKYTGCNLKTTGLLHCGLIEVCAIIRLNTEFILLSLSSTGMRDYGHFCVACHA